MLVLVFLLLALPLIVVIAQITTKLEQHAASPQINQTSFYSFGKAINLASASANPQYITTLPTDLLNNASSNFTVEGWISPLPPASPVGYYSYNSIVTKSWGGGNAYDLTYVSTLQQDGTVLYYYKFGIANRGFGCAEVTASSLNGTVVINGKPLNGEVVPANQVATWKHIAGVVQNGNLYIYENGTLIAKNEFGITSFCGTTSPLQIGGRLLADNTQDSLFQGAIDEVRISDIARYSANFGVAMAPFISDSNTLLLYHFDGDTQDASSHGFNGQAVGNPNYIDSTIVVTTPSPTFTPSPTVTSIPTLTSTPTQTPTNTLTPTPTIKTLAPYAVCTSTSLACSYGYTCSPDSANNYISYCVPSGITYCNMTRSTCPANSRCQAYNCIGGANRGACRASQPFICAANTL